MLACNLGLFFIMIVVCMFVFVKDVVSEIFRVDRWWPVFGAKGSWGSEGKGEGGASYLCTTDRRNFAAFLGLTLLA